MIKFYWIYFSYLFFVVSLLPYTGIAKNLSIDSSNIKFEGEVNDTTHDYEEDESETIFLLVVAIAVMLFCFGIGIVLTLFILSVLSLLVAGGALSLSVLIAFYKKSLVAGFKTFVLATTVFGGTLAGSISTYLVYTFFHWDGLINGLIAGTTSGLVAGILLGLSANYVLKKLYFLLRSKHNTPTET